MFDLAKIFSDNEATHYNYRTGQKQSRVSFYIALASTSALASFFLGKPSNDFLAGALSAEAILVGFSFNVLFYLVANRRVKPSHFVDIEHELRFKKLSKLSDEIFSNVSYFNVVAIFSALLSLCGLMIVSDNFVPNIEWAIDAMSRRAPIPAKIIKSCQSPVRVVFFAILIMFLIESVVVFLRAVGRVGYYFTSLKIMDSEVEDRS